MNTVLQDLICKVLLPFVTRIAIIISVSLYYAVRFDHINGYLVGVSCLYAIGLLAYDYRTF